MLRSAIFVLVALLLFGRFVQCRYTSPLRHIPGPFLASLTGYWLIFVDLAGKRTATIHELHRKYGSVVRIGPSEVSFSDAAVVNQIYTQQTVFMKAPAYDFMSVKPAGIFSLRDKGAHSQRRGLLSHAFSQQSLDNCMPLINDKIDLLLATVARHQGKPLDMLLRFRLLALDIVGELFLGQSFDGLQEDRTPQFLHDGDLHFIQSGLQGNLPWLHKILSMLPIESIQSFLDSSERVAQFGNTAYKAYIKKYGRDSKRRDLLTKILASRSSTAMTDRETYVEIGNLVFAGADTTSTTLTYMFWELARHPQWQKKIQEGLSRSDEKISMDYNRPLPVLEAVINEALRLHPAAPSSLLRVVPAGGADIAGHVLPAATTVSMQCYTTQRDPIAFADPDKFKPERWLDRDMSADAKLLFMPFSRGTRACLGRNLAMMELKGVSAALLSRYSISAPAHTDEQSMTMVDHFLLQPKAGKCDLVFRSTTY